MVALLASGLWLVALGVTVGAVALTLLNQLDWQMAFADFVPGLTLDALTFSTVGALIITRRPAQPIGWLFCVSALGASLEVLAGEYARYGLLTQPGSLTGAAIAAWFSAWGWMLVFALPVGLLVLLFPSGRLPSTRWRPVAWLIGATMIAAAGLEAFGTAPISNVPSAPNPFGIEPFGAEITRLAPALLLPAPVVMVAGVIMRYRNARGHERLQLKWFMYAAVVVLLGITVGPDLVLQGSLGSDAVLVLNGVLGTLAFPCLAIAVAIAVLKHRLYDIDRLINRTLVYAALSSILALTYWLGVVLLESLLRPITAASDLAIVGSTLCVIALFRPLRVRIQTLVDRRFDRQKYDAARTLTEFGSRIRNEVELENLRTELVDIVRQTMRPSVTSLWLKPAERGE